jgi:hypothetical protein
MGIPMSAIPADIFQLYGHVMVELSKGMYGLPKAGLQDEQLIA